MVRTSRSVARRPGVVLLIVMAMLALFASVGLTFVFYAESEANIARTARSGETMFQPDVAPELLLNYFLSQAIYDTDNVYSSLRGHGLARTMYGEDPTRNGKNGIPFNGVGTLSYLHTAGPLNGIDERAARNYRQHDADGFTRDPEYYGMRAIGAAKGRFLGGANAPWTYPGLSNMCLAAVNGAGEVLLPSFHRPWVAGDLADPANPNLTGAAGKYLIMRPRPVDNSGFPMPEDGGGDVRNLPFGPGTKKPGGGYWVNDSIWLDLGFPVMTAPSGKKFKPLFAPLIIDLDGRINLAVHGNLLGTGGAHASHQGWGRWEVNPGRLLDPAEFMAFVSGAGRYGDGKPDGPLGTAQMPPFFSRFNFDAVATAPLAMPAAGSLSVFPSFPAGWDSGNAAEITNHAARYNPYFPVGNDRRALHPSHMEAILRAGGKGSPALTSDLFKLMPKSMGDAKVRNLVTLLSNDIDRGGLLPFLTSGATYVYDPVKRHPVSTPLAFPDPTTGAPPGGDFAGTSFQSRVGALSRLNLNRQLTDYPLPDASAMITDLATFGTAQSERRTMAKDLYDYLVIATGAKDPNSVAVVKGSNEHHAARWLAQLAANIVDFIDNDDYMTPFPWNTSDPANIEFVYGTELPRLVINEAYAQYSVDPNDPDLKNPDPTKAKASFYRLDTWVELYNTFKPTPAGENTPRDGGVAKLKVGAANMGYQVVLAKSDPKLRDPDNARGDVDPAKLLKSVTGADCVVDDFGSIVGLPNAVEPGDGLFSGPKGSNKGFFAVGPLGPHLPGFDPGLGLSHPSRKMSARYGVLDPRDPSVTVLLRRLACPHMPPSAGNNPYITVDYVENVPAWDARGYDQNGRRLGIGKGKGKDPDAPPWLDMYSIGRTQPYAAHASQQRAQVPQPVLDRPKHTFYQQNCIETTAPPPAINYAAAGQTLVPSDWLVHLDRQLINPMELLHVSGYRPHELTQQFVAGPAATDKFKHMAPWFDQSTLIYRLLEIVSTPDLMVGAPSGGRIPGKVNINTIWDVETFRAICDANGLVGYTDAEVDAIFAALVAERTPTGIPSGNDKPFFPLSAGPTPGGGQYVFPAGIDTTLLKANPLTPGTRLFQVPGKTHPYQQMELLTKIYGNLTTRSNVFAMWVTVGFFEVTDDSVRPAKLGQEIGKADNRHIRHRFFAIVDRTQMQMRPVLSSGADMTFTLLPPDLSPTPGTTIEGSIRILGKTDLIFDTINGGKWTIEPGTVLTISPDLPNEETVVVTKTDPPTATFYFQVSKQHKAGETLICRCWPGPWANYDVRRDTRVVPYFTVIE